MRVIRVATLTRPGDRLLVLAGGEEMQQTLELAAAEWGLGFPVGHRPERVNLFVPAGNVDLRVISGAARLRRQWSQESAVVGRAELAMTAGDASGVEIKLGDPPSID